MTKRGYDAIAGPGNMLQCPVCLETNHELISNTHDGRLRCCHVHAIKTYDVLPLGKTELVTTDMSFQCGFVGNYVQWRVSEQRIKKGRIQ